MKDRGGLPLKVFYALCRTYSRLEKENKISQEQLDDVLEVLDKIEELPEEELMEELQEIFPDYTPEEIPRPGQYSSGVEKIMRD